MDIIGGRSVLTDLCPHERIPNTNIHATNTIIIGNGPAGLSLSSFLNGWTPFYDPSSGGHPNKFLHEKLSKNAHVSLLEQDFTWLKDWTGLGDGTSSPARGPLSVLVDSLTRPDADLRHAHPNCIKWNPPQAGQKTVKHLVVGQDTPGGSWSKFSPDVRSLSIGSWLDLPAVSLHQFLNSHEGGKIKKQLEDFESPLDSMVKDICDWPEYCSRLPSWVVHAYYNHYPQLAGLSQNILSNTKVSSLKPLSIRGDLKFKYRWEVELLFEDGTVSTVRCHNVVLATGLSKPVTLPLLLSRSNNHLNENSVYLDVNSSASPSLPFNDDKPSLVIGGGLSSADKVLELLLQNKNVIHVFRKTSKEMKNSLLGRLSKSIYPDYHAVSCLMIGRRNHPLYQAYPNSNVSALEYGESDDVPKKVVLQVNKSAIVKEVNIDEVFVRIGSEPDFGFVVDDDLRQLLYAGAIDAVTYEYVHDKLDGLFAIGSLAGDKFVRYLVGGCMAAARHILSNN